jgi:hypothetical protein
MKAARGHARTYVMFTFVLLILVLVPSVAFIFVTLPYTRCSRGSVGVSERALVRARVLVFPLLQFRSSSNVVPILSFICYHLST